MHDVEHALEVIKEAAGLAQLELNANKQAEIKFADGLVAHITQIDKTNLELSFRLPDLAFASMGMLRAMMMANFLGAGTGAGRLALDPGKEEILYCERWDVTDIDARNVARKFSEFVLAGGYWLTEGGDRVIAAGEAFDRPVVTRDPDIDADAFDDDGEDGEVGEETEVLAPILIRL